MSRILPSTTMAVLIDVQSRLFPHIHDHRALQERLTRLIKGLQALEIPIVLTEQYPQGLGETLPEIKQLLPANTPCFSKMAFSCWDEEAFQAYVRSHAVDTLLLMGIETHVCVLQTALDLRGAGYRVVAIEDAISSRKPVDRQAGLERMYASGVLPATYESILLELCRFSGTPTFKTISQLIR